MKPEFQAILEASLADIADGGQGNNPGYRCGSHGMPRVMIANVPIHFVILPDTTYVILERLARFVASSPTAAPGRRNCRVPRSAIRSADGSTDVDGRHDALEVETRGINGTHVYDSDGAPFHPDNATIVKERISLDQATPSCTTRSPRSTTRSRGHGRSRGPTSATAIPNGASMSAAASNQHVVIGHEDYLMSADGLLMPVRKGQKPPDLRYFDQPR